MVGPHTTAAGTPSCHAHGPVGRLHVPTPRPAQSVGGPFVCQSQARFLVGTSALLWASLVSPLPLDTLPLEGSSCWMGLFVANTLCPFTYRIFLLLFCMPIIPLSVCSLARSVGTWLLGNSAWFQLAWQLRVAGLLFWHILR